MTERFLEKQTTNFYSFFWRGEDADERIERRQHIT